jgi:hypothetical protein
MPTLADSLLNFLKNSNNIIPNLSTSSSSSRSEEVVDFKDSRGNVVIRVSKSRAAQMLDDLNRALDNVRGQIDINDNLTRGESSVIASQARHARVLKGKKSKGGTFRKKRKSAKKKVIKKRKSAKKNKK